MKLNNLLNTISEVAEQDYSHIRSPHAAVNFCSLNNQRFPELEPLILQDSWWAIRYAYGVLKSRWPELEREILLGEYGNSTVNIVDYNRIVIQEYEPSKRWTEAEKLLTDPRHRIKPDILVKYCNEFIKQRWPEAESLILKDPEACINYCFEVLYHRWPEFEQRYIFNREVDLDDIDDEFEDYEDIPMIMQYINHYRIKPTQNMKSDIKKYIKLIPF